MGQKRVPAPGYVTVGDLAKAMDAFNQELLSVCFDDGLECFDLAPLVPKDTSAFFDDSHFNENCSRIVASLLTDHLLSNPPFSEALCLDAQSNLFDSLARLLNSATSTLQRKTRAPLFYDGVW
jgi:hypothetical protein